MDEHVRSGGASGSGRTLKELAERLNVSVATVSRALAGHERISKRTRERVAAAAREAGYVPNRAARALVSGRTGFVGLVLPVGGHGQSDQFLGEFMTGLAGGLADHSIDLFLSVVPYGKSELASVRNIVETKRADGLVLARITENDPRVSYLVEQGFPFVAHGRVLDEALSYDWHDTDGSAAFSEAFNLLYGLGHRHFGLMTIAEPMTFRHMREAGLREAIARCGDPQVRLDTEETARFDSQSRISGIRRMLDRPDRPTAVLGVFDGLAIAVMEEAARMGLRIPEDLSVVGFDNTRAAAHAPPGLTTFDAMIPVSANEMAEMLIDAISRRSGPPVTRLVKASLVLRGSHGPVARQDSRTTKTVTEGRRP